MNIQLSQRYLLKHFWEIRKSKGDNNPKIELHYNTHSITLTSDEGVETESDIPKIDKIEKLITTLRDVLTQSTVDGCIVIESHDVDELIKLYNKIVVDDHIVKLK